MYCVRCGAHNPDDARFCAKCGAAAAAEEAPRSAAPPPPPPHSSSAHGAGAHAATVHPPAAPPPPRPAPPGDGSSGFTFPTIAGGPINDRRTARANIMCGVVAAVAGVVMSLVGMSTLGPTMLLAAAFYAVIAFAIWKSSRVAAVLGLLMALFNIFGLLALSHGNPRPGLILATAVLTVLYWSAVRGTFAEHRLAESGGRTVVA